MSDLETNTIHTGDAFDVLPEVPESSVHSCVTDPPYGLAFMGKSWDDFEPKEYQEWCEEWARKVKRVLKPGAHLLAFSGNRTHHRLFTGVEDAGFAVRDCLTWHYASGFPKASDISKTIDKRADAEREIGEPKMTPDGKEWSDRIPEGDNYREREATYADSKHETHTTIPATDAAKKWDGWKTGLKPATEFVVLARKPFEGATVDCVQEHGTGALNIDGCRIENDVDTSRKNSGKIGDGVKYSEAPNPDMTTGSETGGRYPSNVVFDETEAERLDQEVGELETGDINSGSGRRDGEDGKFTQGTPEGANHSGDSGGPSRYFYTSKATKAERTLDGRIDNAHPTVKPLDLMEWLVRLVTREGQIVIDPFAGSGTTCKAAKSLNRQFIGIEKQAQWADVARVRAGLTPHDPSNVRDTDDAQEGLESFGANEES